ncbi:hypothetical protein COCMIDRAFT_24822 [Bipolaris oryzae ATCC 44560]|uniref:Uncharacterized protein n=1 Tax=Bipolaris oryzae ATCC 44560 TaxID=930090 RepID=W6Z642_COCMI|nr:uncharacterized protein COCMIDRAFT_24822 [Bipolaris oryzae ATCC 44560]EUC47197.1 hypothetical protein COCMIDRAFT_24822 [Bipolaris oryzae ATCC 44560]
MPNTNSDSKITPPPLYDVHSASCLSISQTLLSSTSLLSTTISVFLQSPSPSTTTTRPPAAPMFSPDLDYEMEDETIQERLLPSAEQILGQLKAARELADHQGANQGVYEWLGGVETQPVDSGPLPLLSYRSGTIISLWRYSVSSCLRWASLLAASFKFG